MSGTDAEAAATPDAPAPVEGPRRSRRLRHLRAAFAMSGAMLTALVALVSGGLALYFQLRPDLLPDPRTHRGATAEVFAVDDHVTLRGFLQRRRAIVSEGEYRRERSAYIGRAADAQGGDAEGVMSLPGEDVFLRLGVFGFKSRAVAVLASMYDADARRRVPQLSDVPVFQQHVDAPTDESVIELWLTAPPVTVAHYFIRVTVFHRGDGVLLAVADSRRVTARD